MSIVIRGVKSEQPQATPRYVARGLQTELEREITINDWLATQMSARFPLLAQTEQNAIAIGQYLAEAFVSFDSLNNAVEDLRGKLQWLAETKPEVKERILSAEAQLQDGTKPVLDLTSRSHVARDKAQREADEKRAAEAKAAEAKRRADYEARNTSTSAKPEPLKDFYTASEFKKLSNEQKRRYIQLFPNRAFLPEKTEVK